MNKRILDHALWICGTVLLAAGFALTAQTVRQCDTFSEQQASRMRDRTVLDELEDRLAGPLAAKAAFEALAGAEPSPLEELQKKHLPKYTPADIRNMEEEAVPGWTLVKKELSFRDVPIGTIMALVAEAESERPPWRLAKCVIQSSPGTPGVGQVVLRFETLRPEE